MDLSALQRQSAIIIADLSASIEYHLVDVAPETYADLKESMAGVMPILAPYSDHTVYGDADINRRLRAIHDMHHLAMQAGFDAASEKRVVMEQCRILSHRSTAVADIVAADFMSQIEYVSEHGHFPVDQLSLTLYYRQHGTIKGY